MKDIQADEAREDLLTYMVKLDQIYLKDHFDKQENNRRKQENKQRQQTNQQPQSAQLN